MNDNKHNDSPSTHPLISTSNNDLLTNAEKNQLHSFLNAFNPTDQTHSTSLSMQYNSEEGNSHYSTGTPASPTPILLSPPFSRNTTFGQQHIQALPILDGQQHASYRKFSTDNNNNNNKREMEDNGTHSLDMKKYRLLLDDNTLTSTNAASTIPNLPSSSASHTKLPSYLSSTYTNKNTDTDRHFVMEGVSSSPPSSTTTTTPPPPSTSTSATTTTMKPKGSGRGRKPAHELLSDSQKKANHIASEQKRRANIRIGFDQLVGIVPNLSECQRSESLILHKSADYIRQLVDTKNSLRDRVRELQIALGEVPDEDSSEGEMDFS